MNIHEILALSSLTIYGPSNPLFPEKPYKFGFITNSSERSFRDFHDQQNKWKYKLRNDSVAVQLRMEMNHYRCIEKELKF